jgi:hypothetical protein
MSDRSIQRASWGTLAILGYILSPLSWWNDLWVNIPIAYAAANLARWVHPRLFLPALIAAYWITNLVGLLLLHAGIRGAVADKPAGLNRAALLRWLLISLVYTAVIAGLVHWNVLRPVEMYLPGPN